MQDNTKDLRKEYNNKLIEILKAKKELIEIQDQIRKARRWNTMKQQEFYEISISLQEQVRNELIKQTKIMEEILSTKKWNQNEPKPNNKPMEHCKTKRSRNTTSTKNKKLTRRRNNSNNRNTNRNNKIKHKKSKTRKRTRKNKRTSKIPNTNTMAKIPKRRLKKMIATIDIETQGFTKQFLCGTIKYETPQKTVKEYQTTNKEQLWNKTKEIAKESWEKYKKRTDFYIHNLLYDFPRFATTNDKEITIKTIHPPSISLINEQGIEYSHFYDTLGIFPTSLQYLANKNNQTKKEIPKELKEKNHSTQPQKYTQQEMRTLIEYCQTDSNLLYNAIKGFKKELKEIGLQPRKLRTSGQIALNYFEKEIKKTNYLWEIYKRPNTNTITRGLIIYPPKDTETTQKAHRGGRIQVFNYKPQEKTEMIDQRSQWAYSATQIDFPNPRIQTTLNEEQIKQYNQKTIINQIGATTALLKKETKQIGLLPIRDEKEMYYPKKGYLYGTWTNQELKTATEKADYTIKKIYKTNLYATLPTNPLKKIMQTLYKKRQESIQYDYAWKPILTHLCSKFAQKKGIIEIEEDEYDNKIERQENGWERQRILPQNKAIYERMISPKPRFYFPMLSSQIKAHARIMLWEALKKIPEKDLIYCATDSIVYLNDHKNKFKLGNEMGDWRIIKQGTFNTYGKNTYQIDNEIKISGIHKGDYTKEDYKNGEINYTKMTGLTWGLEKAGEITKHKRDLNTQKEQTQQKEEQRQQLNYHIDKNEEKIPPEVYQRWNFKKNNK